MKHHKPQLIAGRDFPDFFGKDLFSLRRSGSAFAAGNPYDPESLLTGEEAAAGYTYANSRRVWPSPNDYLKAISGKINTAEILKIAPRRLLNPMMAEVVELRLGPKVA